MPQRKPRRPVPDELFPEEPPEVDEGPEPELEPSELDLPLDDHDEPLPPEEDEDLDSSGEQPLMEDAPWWRDQDQEEPMLPPQDDGSSELFSPVQEDTEDGIDWDTLEDETRGALAFRPTLGWRTRVSLAGVGWMVALCDVASARTTISASIRPLGDGFVLLTLADGMALTVPGALGPPPAVNLSLTIREQTLAIFALVVPPGDEPALSLGRDTLAGRFLVDPDMDGAN